jgi:hypothetical protein
VWPSTTNRKTIYNKAARRRQLNLKSYWTIQCNRILTYNITLQCVWGDALSNLGKWKTALRVYQKYEQCLNLSVDQNCCPLTAVGMRAHLLSVTMREFTITLQVPLSADSVSKKESYNGTPNGTVWQVLRKRLHKRVKTIHHSRCWTMDCLYAFAV